MLQRFVAVVNALSASAETSEQPRVLRVVRTASDELV